MIIPSYVSFKDKNYKETFYNGVVEVYGNGKLLYSLRSGIIRLNVNDAIYDANERVKEMNAQSSQKI